MRKGDEWIVRFYWGPPKEGYSQYFAGTALALINNEGGIHRSVWRIQIEPRDWSMYPLNPWKRTRRL